MQFDRLPDWTDLMYKVDAKEPLDPVEQFIYNNEPAGAEDGDWRLELQAALYFFGGAPQDKGDAGLHPPTPRKIEDTKELGTSAKLFGEITPNCASCGAVMVHACPKCEL